MEEVTETDAAFLREACDPKTAGMWMRRDEGVPWYPITWFGADELGVHAGRRSLHESIALLLKLPSSAEHADNGVGGAPCVRVGQYILVVKDTPPSPDRPKPNPVLCEGQAAFNIFAPGRWLPDCIPPWTWTDYWGEDDWVFGHRHTDDPVEAAEMALQMEARLQKLLARLREDGCVVSDKPITEATV